MFSLRSSEGEGGTGSCSRRPPAPTPDEMRPPQNLQISCTGSPHRPASHGTKVKVAIFTFATFTFHFGDIHVFTGDMKVFFFHWQCWKYFFPQTMLNVHWQHGKYLFSLATRNYFFTGNVISIFSHRQCWKYIFPQAMLKVYFPLATWKVTLFTGNLKHIFSQAML